MLRFHARRLGLQTRHESTAFTTLCYGVLHEDLNTVFSYT